MKIFKWIGNNLLFVATLVLLAFIPLYPKIPLLDIGNTWVYVRVEDFLVVLAIIAWAILLLLKKITLKTPLTFPILLFWIVGGISTLHGVLIIFPTLANVFSNVAFLSLLRRIEYIFLFFIAFAAMKEKKFLLCTIFALAIILLLIVGYGFGQKLFGFPAFLTMNEEFAKGIPIQLSQLSRVPSTFAGHYDLAAYLVFVIPILVGVSFGFKNWLIKIFFLATASLGFGLLFMTVSRVSFLVLIISLVMLLIFQKKKLIVISLFAVTVIFLIFSPRLLERFGSTVTEIDVLVDARTGEAIGQVKDVPGEYFKDKLVVRQLGITGNVRTASISAIVIPFSLIPPRASLVVEPNSPNGENLPQGTSYINLPLSPAIKKLKQYYYEKSDTKVYVGSESAEVLVFYGDFLVKKAKAYDLSFTTRFQGEWPRTLTAFTRNIFLGSGYGSVSLAVDNDYLRILGETGLLGFISFSSIFLIAGIYIIKILPKVDSPLTRSFIFGFAAGTFGLMLNATLIDVFEASKVAFTFWLLMGVTLGMLHLYSNNDIDFSKEFKKAVTSPLAIISYLFIATVSLFSGVLNYYFVGDDYTWFRWVADCSNCNFFNTIIDYFTNSNGFFYRPGTKIYFLLMYKVFWLNQTMYHLVSLTLNFLVVILIFLISKRIFKNNLLSFGTSLLFVILAAHHEVIFWISSTGFLFNTVFALMSLFLFIYWKEKGRRIYLLASFVSIAMSLLFHEIGVIVPFIVILYDIVFREKALVSNLSKKTYYLIVLFPILPYLILRFIAQSHWLSGDYSYSLIKLPFNIVGNLMGYTLLSLLGPSSLSIYEKLRLFSKDSLTFSVLGITILVFIFVIIYRFAVKKMDLEDKKIAVFGFLFFVISLLPFLGLGNIASRYNYLSSFGFVILLVFFLKKLFGYLSGSGKYIALAAVAVIIVIFSSTQLFQLQRIQIDWKEAGNKSNNFLASLDWIYAHYSSEDTSKLYFVDVPIRNGEAWVFPVGLSDAVWLVFRNNSIKVSQAGTVKEAFDALGTSNGSVFKFNNKGGVTKFVKIYSGEIVPVND